MNVSFIIGIAVIVAFGFSIASWVIGIYNNIRRAFNNYEGMLADLKTEYQRRWDLFNNLVASVKGEVKFEKGIQTEIARLRSGMQDFKGKVPTVQEITKLEGMFAGMKIQFERYPELKANESFRMLNGNIKNTEDRISVGRGELNRIAEGFNMWQELFPTSLLAKRFGAKKLEYFDVEDSKMVSAPKVSF